MRLTKWLFALALVSSFAMSCGNGQPRYYRIGINRTPLENLPASCYAGGIVPPTTDKSTNVVEVQQWSLWDGTDGKLELVIGDMSVFSLGNAERVRVNGDAIEGGPTTFSEIREQVNPQRTVKTITTVVFTDLGPTARGTLTLDSNTTCTNCGTPACKVDMAVTGRLVDSTPTMIYTPAP